MPSKFSSGARKLSLVALGVFAAVTSASAQFYDATGPYIGGNVGRTRANFDNDRITNSLAGQGFRINSIKEDDRDTGYKIFGGYQLNRNFAIEAGYFDLGKHSYGFTTVPFGTFNGETRVHGLNLDLVGIAPLSDRFSLFGRVGAAYARSKTDVSRTGNIVLNNFDSSTNKTNVKVGLGLQYAITPALAVRGELERYRINDPIRNKGHIDMASIGLVYRFGGIVQQPAPQAAYVPVVVTPPPPPPPVVMAPPPPPPPPVVMAPPPPPPPPYVPPARPAKPQRN